MEEIKPVVFEKKEFHIGVFEKKNVFFSPEISN